MNVKKIVVLACLLVMAGLLTATIVKLEVRSVYYNQGEVHILMDPEEGLIGEWNEPPTVYCCGTDVFWVTGYANQLCYFYVDQNGRTGCTARTIPNIAPPGYYTVQVSIPVDPNHVHRENP
ncbi:MAG: hypothetical protein K8R90_06725 [Candidatus Cloacimonetes bacterium]|nr:hypothetical protein [Candidatus Cloacimonadota bacterium]